MKDNNNTGGLFFLGLFLAVGLIIAVLILSGTLKDIKSSGHVITVKGYAEKNINSDLGKWSCNITSRSTDMITAFNKLKSDISRTK